MIDEVAKINIVYFLFSYFFFTFLHILIVKFKNKIYLFYLKVVVLPKKRPTITGK